MHCVASKPVPVVQLPAGVGSSDDRKTYIDMVQNVFGGVRISPEDEPRSPVVRRDIRGRPWLTGVTMSSVHVTLANEEDTEEKTAENKEEKTEKKDDDPGS